MALPDSDWLALCRRAAHAARAAVADMGTTAERSVPHGEGEGGDTTLAVDKAAEDAVFAELEAFGVPLVAVSEERGEVAIGGGSADARVVVDPVDGSVNAKRGLPFACVSIAVASGARMQDVEVGFVAELTPVRDWWAVRGEGAFCDGERLAVLEPGPLELLGLETARPERVAAAAEALGSLGARRLRALGSVAASMCLVAGGRLDAMITLREVRSVDVAAAQLIVREAGGVVALPGGDALDLEMRSRATAARDQALLDQLAQAFPPPS
ncbi:MAG: monophosphatase [Thermoleophilaceae bacterium]|jgi:myo-inositol-1(or 4)-monophosphatase|nr:monophosphatase [Thermoleophilaceae bacterium]